MKRKKAFFRSKKGNAIADSTLMIIALIAFAMISLFGYVIFNEINTDIQTTSDFSNLSKNLSGEAYADYPDIMDSNFVFFMILFWAFTIIASFMINSRPIFFILSMIILVLIIIVGGFLANAYDDIANDPEFGNLANEFPMTNFILSHFVQVVVIMMGTILLALYGKLKLG